jgi:hypothetical protein
MSVADIGIALRNAARGGILTQAMKPAVVGDAYLTVIAAPNSSRTLWERGPHLISIFFYQCMLCRNKKRPG